jgi:hypothetical protein
MPFIVAVLTAIGVAEEIAPRAAALIERLMAEKRDPTPEEIASLKQSEAIEDEEFNSDLPPNET